MRRGTATTLSDVAKEAGVTAMTVSVVLNGSQSGTRVSETTRVRIKEAASRLRYRPNGMARGLVRRKVDTIGIVSPVDRGDSNLYFFEILNGVLDAARIHRQNTTILSLDEWTIDAQRIIEFADGRVDSMVLLAPLLDPAVVAQLVAQVPIAAIHPNYEYEGVVNVQPDELTGAYEATQYLIAQGHREIAHFAGPEEWIGGHLRKEGFLTAMMEHGLEVPPSRIMRTKFSTTDGRACMKSMLESCSEKDLPTAIFCGSDAVAFGCMQVLADAGIPVPSRISIVGFDDNMLSRLSSPEMTTVRQPFNEMARRAISKLVEDVAAHADARRDVKGAGIESTWPAQPQTTTEMFPVELIVRGSVANRHR